MKRKITIALAGGVLLLAATLYARRYYGPQKHQQIATRLVVHKSRRQLLLYSAGKYIQTYRIALGRDPVHDKVHEGDGCTPEGRYYVSGKNARSHFNLALALSYPNTENAVRGLKAGQITQAQYRQIVTANRLKRAPPQNTPLGGQIMIHGGGTQSDWTAGCIALENADIETLFDAVPVGTAVVIEH